MASRSTARGQRQEGGRVTAAERPAGKKRPRLAVGTTADDAATGSGEAAAKSRRRATGSRARDGVATVRLARGTARSS
ncbi:MAG: hypothetical protein O3C39_09995, partial [Planctomycetota bacterium]|nr:hypothetical protein [Planctomycetota bacterium]